MPTDIQLADSALLYQMAAELKADARRLYAAGHKPEAMRLFKLWRAVTAELHARTHTAYLYN